MKYTTILLGLAIVLAAIATAQAATPFLIKLLDGEWCRDDGKSSFAIWGTTLHDTRNNNDEHGTYPVCELKRHDSRQSSMTKWEYKLTWYCDPTPQHEPEDKPTPRRKYFTMTEQLIATRDMVKGMALIPQRNGAVEIFKRCEP